ncbi:hypothetical protein ENUP19_0307G0014 [Entamoeba nuttalli]|uniref:RING-type domain-containing protein n=2 Tax=Entamoeba nuttalli TaxID=412467 RepID=K2H3E7_ENTNP|nr:hypothetical protein ENU1_036160 [Entamoeba nuttalli P19]EKE42008.1 hypothetical protein ENU1_036160 [Entamoeba nuttalli P19]|eukprot:XP_008855654.1 hypothetical protein ENU1_036160 [Entamoeba nuttalli P19]
MDIVWGISKADYHSWESVVVSKTEYVSLDIYYSKTYDEELEVVIFLNSIDISIGSSFKIEIAQKRKNGFMVQCTFDEGELLSFGISYIAFLPIPNIIEKRVNVSSQEIHQDLSHTFIGGISAMHHVPNSFDLSLSTGGYKTKNYTIQYLKINNDLIGDSPDHCLTCLYSPSVSNQNGLAFVKELSTAHPGCEALPILHNFFSQSNTIRISTFQNQRKDGIIISLFSDQTEKVTYCVLLLKMKVIKQITTTEMKLYQPKIICYLCQSNTADCVFKSCSHLSICSKCLTKIKEFGSAFCPVCGICSEIIIIQSN